MCNKEKVSNFIDFILNLDKETQQEFQDCIQKCLKILEGNSEINILKNKLKEQQEREDKLKSKFNSLLLNNSYLKKKLMRYEEILFKVLEN